MAKLSPILNSAQFIDGVPAVGGKIFTYVAGSTTPLATYTDSSGITAQSNPIILDSRGEPLSPIWLAEGLAYKLIFTASTDDDPPTSPINVYDNITGVGDNTVVFNQWQDTAVVPTYINATTFTVPGDQTSTFTVGRRVQAFTTSGTVYGYITSSVFTTLTTVEVLLDSGTLDSGLSTVKLGLLTPDNNSIPLLTDNYPIVANNADPSKKLRFDLSLFTTAITRIFTWPNRNGTVALLDDVEKINIISFRGLANSATGTNANVSSLIDEIIIEDSTNLNKTLRNVSLTINTSVTGVNGIDTGSTVASTWYSVWVIYNPTTSTTAGLVSLSATTPTIPAGYTYKARIGWIRTDATANKYPLNFIQKNRNVQYVIQAATNLTAVRVMASGNATWPSAVSLTNFVPTTAISIDLLINAVASQFHYIGPNTSWDSAGGLLIGSYASGSGEINSTVRLLIESSNIYRRCSGGTSSIICMGWEDNI